MFEVKDGTRTLKFDGTLLATSSSWMPGSVRWIEFELYKTVGGRFLLSRVGVSHVFHASTCYLVSKYGLHEGHITELKPDAAPCEICNPDDSDPIVFPETFRYWTLNSDDPEAVLGALYKEDKFGARYLTKVSQRLLEDAADADSEIDQAYRTEYIQ